MKLTPEQKAALSSAIKAASYINEVRMLAFDRTLFRQRARRAFARNLAEPGDCAGNLPLLAGLAVAEAEIGRVAGWIPEVQRIGCAIAKAIEA